MCVWVHVRTTGNKRKAGLTGHKSDQRYRNYYTTQTTALSEHWQYYDHYPDFANIPILCTKIYSKQII